MLPRLAIPNLQIEEDPGESLARQLIIYKRFKELSRFLEERESAGLRTYLRLDTSPRTQLTAHLDLEEFTLDELVQAARDIFSSAHNLPPLSEVVAFPRITIRQKISTILDKLKMVGETSFKNILNADHSRVEIVVTFLALLELVKRHMVGASQETLFGEILLQPEGELTGLDDQELEFVD